MFSNCNFIINSTSKDSTNIFLSENICVAHFRELSGYYGIFHQGEI